MTVATAAAKTSVLPLILAEQEWALPYLSLGMISTYLRRHDQGKLLANYDIFSPLPGGTEAQPLDAIYKSLEDFRDKALVCLFSSYVWNHEFNLGVAASIREQYPQALIIFGGPEIPRYDGETEAFLAKHSFIDIAVLGEGEIAAAEILTNITPDINGSRSSLLSVTGIVYREEGVLYRTGTRKRLKSLDVLPSPYLEGEFEPWLENFPSTILETNRGCPFGCTYCDWGSATLQNVSKFAVDRVCEEIRYLARRRSHAIFIADANFGMLEQDIAIARALVESRISSGYPRRVYTNFAKNGGRRLMEVISILHEGGLLPVGIIALQTTDRTTLQAIKRDNIKQTSYETMMRFFNDRNIPMASDIMVGLPGQTYESLLADLQFCFDWKVSANGNYTSLMPNAPMAEKDYRNAHNIVSDSRGMVISTSSFSAADRQKMQLFFSCYVLCVRFGLFKYCLYLLQVEYGLPAMGLLDAWLKAGLERDQNLPLGQRVIHGIVAQDSPMPDWALLQWDDNTGSLFTQSAAICEEFLDYSLPAGTTLDESVRSTLTAAQASVLPDNRREYPCTVDLPHDIVSWFQQIKTVASLDELDETYQRLAEFEPGRLVVNADQPRLKSMAFRQIDGHSDAWELKSPLAFAQA